MEVAKRSKSFQKEKSLILSKSDIEKAEPLSDCSILQPILGLLAPSHVMPLECHNVFLHSSTPAKFCSQPFVVSPAVWNCSKGRCTRSLLLLSFPSVRQTTFLHNRRRCLCWSDALKLVSQLSTTISQSEHEGRFIEVIRDKLVVPIKVRFVRRKVPMEIRAWSLKETCMRLYIIRT